MEDTQITETTTAPSSFSEAAAALEASSASTPVADTSTESPAPAATTQAVDQTTAGTEGVNATPEKKGEPPAWRWQDILANTRETVAKETADRVKQEVEQQYAGLQDFAGLDPQERAGLVIWNRALRGDPAALSQVAQVNPSLAAAISGKAAPAQTEPEPEPQPDAAIQLADGTQVPVYTPEGMKKREAWLQTHLAATLEAQFTEKFKPALSAAERFEQQQQAEQREAETKQWAAKVLSPLSRLPYFKEFMPGIGEALAAVPKDFTGNLEDVVMDSYARLLTAKTTGLASTTRTAVLADMHAKPAGNTVRPGATTISLPKRPKDFYEAAQMLADQSG